MKKEKRKEKKKVVWKHQTKIMLMQIQGILLNKSSKQSPCQRFSTVPPVRPHSQKALSSPASFVGNNINYWNRLHVPCLVWPYYTVDLQTTLSANARYTLGYS